MMSFECVNCSRRVDTDKLDARCARCGSALLLAPNSEIREGINRSDIEAQPPGLWRFRAFLPKVAEEHTVTLGEGATPLLQARRLGDELGFSNLWIKDESRNPTGSFIDRGSTVLVSLAKERRVEGISCTTTGNLGASLAAYCAKAGIDIETRIHPNTDHGKLYQMIAYGARVEIIAKINQERDYYDSDGSLLSVTAANPFILEGEKTTGFEIIQDLDWKQPDAIVVPVGTGGHLTMIWRGIQQLYNAGLMKEEEEGSSCSSIKMIGVQLQASAPIVDILHLRKIGGGRGRRSSKNIALSEEEEEEEPLTELEESEPIFKKTAVQAIRSSKGHGIEVSAREAIQATSLLARTEGIFAEPASASVVASLDVMREEGRLERNDRVVCVITGAGLKDTKIITRIAGTPKHVIAREELIVRPLEIGSTKQAILNALKSEPNFGYNLWKLISSAEKKSITTASVYQHLSELEGASLIRRTRVARVKGRERILYELTRKGREFLGVTVRMKKKNKKGDEGFAIDRLSPL